MAAIKVIYWSQSGNTQAMANAVAEGIKEAGKEAEAVFVTEANINDIKDDTAVALGCPAMGAEVLEEADMEPFVTSFESIAAGKNVALFGSYGWGDGEWMRDWTERMIGAGANVLNGEGLICQEAPDDEMIEECKNLGKQLANC
ncbi:flavodoxin [Lachnospiraceae bacterium HCP1S3_C3]|nr:flavodoxin [Lachnospiraceae bacterium]